MQQIEPIQWNPEQIATQLQVWNINDNLETNCSFGWQLLTAQGAYVDTGTISCAGVEYLQWDGNRQFPYDFVANFLGLILI
jgi:hypothetical protein